MLIRMHRPVSIENIASNAKGHKVVSVNTKKWIRVDNFMIKPMFEIRWLINNGVDTVEIFGEPDENGWSGTAINGTSARNHTH